MNNKTKCFFLRIWGQVLAIPYYIRDIYRLLRGYKVLIVYLADYGSVWIEDSKCPLNWRGSGVYDIECPYYRYRAIVMIASSEQQAVLLAKNEKLDCEYTNCEVLGVIKATQWWKLKGANISIIESFTDSADEYNFYDEDTFTPSLTDARNELEDSCNLIL